MEATLETMQATFSIQLQQKIGFVENVIVTSLAFLIHMKITYGLKVKFFARCMLMHVDVRFSS